MKQAGQQDLRREGNHWPQWIQQVLDFSLGYVPQAGGSVSAQWQMRVGSSQGVGVPTWAPGSCQVEITMWQQTLNWKASLLHLLPSALLPTTHPSFLGPS